MKNATEVYTAWLHLKDFQAIRLWYNDDTKKDIIIYPEDYVVVSNNEDLIRPGSRMGKFIVKGNFLEISKKYERVIKTIHEDNIIKFKVISKTMAEQYEFEQILNYELTHPDKDFDIKEAER